MSAAAGFLPVRELLLVGSASAGATLIATSLIRVAANRLGAVAWPRGRDVHVVPTPRWGGIAMLLGVATGLALSAELPALRLAYDSGEILGVALGATVICLVGALDDKYELGALAKLIAQIAASGPMIIFGVQWTNFWLPWGSGDSHGGTVLLLSQYQGVAVSLLVTVGLVNAMNFIDGLDGLAAGVGLIAASATAVFAIGLIYKNGNDPSAYSPALIATVLAGACSGFLPHNFNPARIFMGDSGSMLIGLLLAASVTGASGRIPISGSNGADALALLAPIIVVAAVVFIPTLDMFLAIARRTRTGMPISAPDKKHIHHRFLDRGHSHRRAVLLIYAWASLLAFGAVSLALFSSPSLVLGVVTAIGIPLGILSVFPFRSRRPSLLTPP